MMDAEPAIVPKRRPQLACLTQTHRRSGAPRYLRAAEVVCGERPRVRAEVAIVLQDCGVPAPQISLWIGKVTGSREMFASYVPTGPCPPEHQTSPPLEPGPLPL